jgi:hypothetical protein
VLVALVIFRSRAASAIIMYSDAAQRLLELIGKPMSERGVITVDQIDDALAKLQHAIDTEGKAPPGDAHEDHSASAHVGLRQRAYPLLEMLRAARRSKVDVTWGV